ncbi:MAG: hypothetical protein IPL53_14735 [Ignavibacteria bacterium]|nr:hypothetical protein [Ignavibacteria bacterium]
MKTILLLITTLLLSIQVNSQTKTFKTGMTGAYFHYGFSNTKWNWYEDLHMNTWSSFYAGNNYPNNLKINELIDSLHRSGMEGYFEPDTLRWAGYGREQIIQAEISSDRFRYDGHSLGLDTTDNWMGETQRVRYFNAATTQGVPFDPPSRVLDSVYENSFQSLSGLADDPLYEIPLPINVPPYVQKVINTYYVKPRMRISTQDAFGSTKNVAKVVIKAFNGDVVSEFIIRTNNFRDFIGSSYNGEYIEDYFFLNLFVRADSLNRGRTSHDPALISSCKVDYEIYWYGEVMCMDRLSESQGSG